MNNKIEEFKRERWTFEYENELAAPSISSVSKECKSVNVDVELTFISAFSKETKVINRILEPTDKAYLHFDCLNSHCTGYGFSLHNLLRQAISTKQTLIGEIKCEGKEDWKYMKHTGFSCSSSCKYKIEPIFE